MKLFLAIIATALSCIASVAQAATPAAIAIQHGVDVCLNEGNWTDAHGMIYPAGYKDCVRIMDYVQQRLAAKLPAADAKQLAHDKVTLKAALAAIAASNAVGDGK